MHDTWCYMTSYMQLDISNIPACWHRLGQSWVLVEVSSHVTTRLIARPDHRFLHFLEQLEQLGRSFSRRQPSPCHRIFFGDNFCSLLFQPDYGWLKWHLSNVLVNLSDRPVVVSASPCRGAEGQSDGKGGGRSRSSQSSLCFARCPHDPSHAPANPWPPDWHPGSVGVVSPPDTAPSKWPASTCQVVTLNWEEYLLM